MKQLWKRHYTTSFNQLRKSTSISDNIDLLKSSPANRTPILYASLLQTCTRERAFRQGLQFQAHVTKTGLEGDRFVGNSLLALYFKLCPSFRDTEKVFDGMLYKDVVSWSSMISGYIRAGKPKLSVHLYVEMVGTGLNPNAYTLSTVVKACSELQELRLGKCFHGVVIKCNFETNYVIVSSLIDMYGRSYESADSQMLFDELLEPDSVCWTALISAYTRNDLYKKALELFCMMHRESGIFPDGYTFGSLLSALGNMGWLGHCKQVHSKVITGGFSGNLFIESSLVDTYAKCGLTDESQRVFDRMVEKNAVSWCALLGGYCQRGDYDTVIQIFRKMDEVNLYCFGTILRACTGLAAVRLGKEIHCQYLRKSGWKDIVVESALVDLYAKCGCINFAHRIFVQMSVRNVITWNSMISGFAQNGRGEEAVEFFDKMIKVGVRPDNISFVNVLFACSHSGLLDQGRRYFISMTDDYGIKAEVSHYSCMVDLLGRASQIEEAENLVSRSEFRDDSSLWISLLGACTTGTNPTVAERVAKKVIKLKPEHHLNYVLLGNVYREVGRWNDASETMRQMKDKNISKIAGLSWVES